MKSTDIRIGAWVTDNYGKKIQLWANDILNIQQIEYAGTEEILYEPIALSAHIMSHQPFLRHENGPYYKLNIDRNRCLAIHPVNKVHTWKVFLEEYKTDHDPQSITINEEVIHLHTLQNIYHALTGKELIITP